MSDWEEIRRLQADLQRVQSSSTANRLSDRNCVEVVSKLVEMGLLEVIYTLDGKEYIVPQHLEREIRDELAAHRGRINVVDLQQILNVDLSHIEKGVANLMRRDSTLQLVQGELISRLYKDHICHEINELLLQNGNTVVAELSKRFSLPLSYITECIESSLGSKIHGQLDRSSGGGVLYTDSYVARHRARIRGLFTAITVPTPVAPFVAQGHYQENLFHSVLRDLIRDGELAGALYGRADKEVYIPGVYTQMQNQWVDSFLASNGYLEYDTIARLGIEDSKGYIKRRFKGGSAGGELIMLGSCAVGQSVMAEVEGAVEEASSSKTWVDILSLLPSPCTPQDANLLLQKLYSSDDQLLVMGSVAVSKHFMLTCSEAFQPLLKEKALKAVAVSGKFLKQVSQEAASPSGGAEGKKGKQKRGRGKKHQTTTSDEPPLGSGWEIKFMSTSEIEQVLYEKFEDLPEDFASELAEELQSTKYRDSVPIAVDNNDLGYGVDNENAQKRLCLVKSPWQRKPLQERFEREAREVLAAQAEGEAGVRRKRYSALQEQVQGLWSRARLFDKGAHLFEGDAKTQMCKYLLRSLCSEMMNLVVKFLTNSNEEIESTDSTDVAQKKRAKMINEGIDDGAVKKLAVNVNTSLTGKETNVFFEHFENLCFDNSVGIMLRKLDKKKEKQLLHDHYQSLLASLSEEHDPSMVLHLVTVLLFQQHTGSMIHITGRLVPHTTSLLSQHLPPDQYLRLMHYQDLVVTRLKLASRPVEKEPLSGEEDGSLAKVNDELTALMDDIKALVIKQ